MTRKASPSGITSPRRQPAPAAEHGAEESSDPRMQETFEKAAALYRKAMREGLAGPVTRDGLTVIVEI
jgi:hypothetical protein